MAKRFRLELKPALQRVQSGYAGMATEAIAKECQGSDEDGHRSTAARLRLAAVIGRCMEADPMKRYRDAHELAETLDALKADHPWSPRLRLLRHQEEASQRTVRQSESQTTQQTEMDDPSVSSLRSAAPSVPSP